LLAAIPGSHSAIAYSNPDRTDQPGGAYDIRGRWDLANLQKLAMPLKADFYLCGPSAFMQDMKRDLVSLGVPQNAIHQEAFGSAGSIEPGVKKVDARPPHSLVPPGSGPIVSFTRSGLSVPWDARFANILELAEACDVPVRWSCRTGVCHTCECAILDGQVRYAPEPLDLPARGQALICCSTPESRIELDL
jgi:ferredoxin